jgi:DnaJ-class molecular chaperone
MEEVVMINELYVCPECEGGGVLTLRKGAADVCANCSGTGSTKVNTGKPFRGLQPRYDVTRVALASGKIVSYEEFCERAEERKPVTA